MTQTTMERPTEPAPIVVLACSVPAGTTAKYACRCCGMESDNVELFAIGSCWACSAGNFDCARCLDAGVEVSRFGAGPIAKAHLLATVDRTRCGVTMTPETMTGAAERDLCRRCFGPDESA